MGPQATIELYQRIVHHTGAETDQEHLRAIIDSNPKIPDRQAAMAGTGPDPTPALCETARNLERAGAGFLVIPCNSAHIFLPAIRASVDIPVLSIVEETLLALRERLPTLHTLGLMATDAVANTGLYATPLQEEGIRVLVPSATGQRLLTEAVYAVKAGYTDSRVRSQMASVAKGLIRSGSQVLLLACTEIPLVLGPTDVEVPVLDTLDILARAAVREAGCT
jgi:aspartate racemase